MLNQTLSVSLCYYLSTFCVVDFCVVSLAAFDSVHAQQGRWLTSGTPDIIICELDLVEISVQCVLSVYVSYTRSTCKVFWTS